MRGVTVRLVLVLLVGLSFQCHPVSCIRRRFNFLGFALNARSRVSAHNAYRKTLEEQVQLLERQLRSAKDESTQLRKLLKLSSASSRKATVERTRVSRTMEESLRDKLSCLQTQISKLQELLQKAEDLMDEEGKKSMQLDQLLQEERHLSVERQRGYEREINELEKTLLHKSKQQLEELKVLMERRVKEAAEEARVDALKEVDRKVEEATKRVKTQAEKKLETERKKSQQAVDRERVKMRKLVKALAEREKNLVRQTITNVDMTTTPVIPSRSTIASSSGAAQKVKQPAKVATPYLP